MASVLFSDFQILPRPTFVGRPGARPPSLILRRSQDRFSFAGVCPSPALLRGSFSSRAGPAPNLPDFETAQGVARELFDRVEGIVYTLADAVVSSDAAAESSKQSSDWLTGITNYLETVLKVLKDGLSSLHVPYAYGFAIILLTVLVKAATFPLTKKQVESALAMRALQPQVKAIQQHYADDQERMRLETARLYKLAGINPLAGCLPTLLTIPVWIGLYRALSNVANEGLLTEGFFWIPSLSGPTTIAARQSGSGISWLFPFVDGHPPLGWSDTFAYLALPVLLVISQYISTQIMQSSQGNDPSQQNAQVVTKFLPLLIGYFALSVPSGLSLYWLTNNILSTAQQIWLQKLGGAKNPVQDYINSTARDEASNRQKATSTQKSISDIRNELPKLSQGQQKDTTNGLRPGERFKQLKKEEARRRKEREEEKKRKQEASEGSHIIKEQQSSETTPVGSSDKLVESTDKQVLTKETEVPSSITENGQLHLKNTTTDKDAIGLGDDKKEEAASLTGDPTTQNSLEKRDESKSD
ncbi:ALBINO3-like protein 1, chloroplastic [Canna indica]|uniref:ALBINO3-like protein 1, chloroplastic n=1 Tax=Canna indica TaxID=4628 RepID=A0AAQ3KWP8_9LILI|nr:ALBINO3-like protein 1, chloroplastic [Canna indica]